MLTKKRNKKPVRTAPDKQLLIVVISLIFFGLMAVLSAGAPEGAEFHSNPAYFAIKQGCFYLLGICVMIFFVKYDYRKLQKFAVPVTFLSIGLLVATLIPGLGQKDYGSARWLAVLPFQPSELAKPACVLLLASALTKTKNLFDDEMLKTLGLVAVMLVVVLLQPNLSMALMLAFITTAMLFVGGLNFSIVAFGFIAAVPVVAMYIKSNAYQLKRITGWLDPWGDAQGTGYNLIQSLYAIGSGGLFGVGYGFSKQKYFWLPFRHTDFIFAIVAEELGFFGALLLLGLFIMLIYRGFRIAYRSETNFGKYLAFGITFAIGIQAFINIGVATGVLPITGMTLPLISYGGSSIVMTLMMLGVLLNISRKRIGNLQPREVNYG